MKSKKKMPEKKKMKKHEAKEKKLIDKLENMHKKKKY